MLSKVMKYSSLYTKTKALESNLLTYDDYATLATQKDTKSFGDMLFEDDKYKEYTREMQITARVGRQSLEKIIMASMYDNFKGVYAFINDQGARKYVDAAALKYKAGLIKHMLRALYGDSITGVKIPKNNYFLHEREQLTIEKLFAARTLEDFYDVLNQTEFRNVLTVVNSKSPSLYDIETQIDFHCIVNTWQTQNRYLRSDDRRVQAKVNGADIDIHNAMFIYRLKKHYNFDPSQIYAYLIPINYKLKKDVIESLVNTSSEDDFRDVLSRTAYKDVFTGYDMTEMERAFYMYMLKLNNNEEQKNAFSIQPVISYFFKKGQEVRNLVTMIECIKYGLKAEETMKKINVF